MCRIAAYAGPPLPISVALYDAPHSLAHQAHSPRQMLHGHVNVDGTGAAWWSEGEEDDPPLRYVTDRPPWADANLPGLARRMPATMALVAVRNASPGVPFGPANVAPFVLGNLACVHNGSIGKFRDATGRQLAERLPNHLYAAIDAVSDSLLVFLTIVRHLEAAASAGLVTALRAAVQEIVDVCTNAGTHATLNIVLADGHRLAAVRSARGTEGNNPLYLLQGGALAPGGAWLASEPLDGDDGWELVDDDHIVDMTADGATVTRLES